jgi:tetratricopeptide (TPR) repeat protein
MLIVFAYLLACLAVLFSALLGISFGDSYRQQYPWLSILAEDPTQLLLASVVCWVMAYAAKLLGEFLSLKPQLESVNIPGGQLAQKATRQSVENELLEAESEMASEARPYLEAGQRDFTAGRYREAVGNFSQSIDVLPTMSAYLNLGLSLMYLWEYRQAEEKFLSGMQLARSKGSREFEGAFLNNLGTAYYRDGKYGRSLEFYRSALKFYEQLGDSVGQAAVFHNSGIVYHAQGKLEEALKS